LRTCWGDPPPPFLRQPAGCSTVSDYEEDGVRVTTAFNRMLGLPGAWVRDVEFGERAVIVRVALRRKHPVCSGCGVPGVQIKDHRVKRWRHLDLGGVRCVIECRLRRLYCPSCGDLPEMVEWARGGARYTRDFDDLVAWLAQQMSQTQVRRAEYNQLRRIGAFEQYHHRSDPLGDRRSHQPHTSALGGRLIPAGRISPTPPGSADA
jgi:zinc-finger of transposase IS204/IS1001/IS1096/IS1165/Helix-turn-helix domain of transposase family ISL3